MPSRRVLRLLCTLGIMCLLLTATAVEAGKKRRRQGKKKGRTSTKSTTRKKKRRTVSEHAEAQALELFEQGNNAFDSLDFEAAARLYDQARQMDPHLLMGHVNYGLALRRLPDSDGTKLHAAAQALLQGIDLNPYHEGIPGAFNHLGAVRRRQGRFEDAVDAYRNAVQRNWTDASVHFNLGTTLFFDLGRYEEAVEAFRAGLSSAPSHADALTTLGKIHRRSGYPKRSLLPLRKALKLDPFRPDTTYELARSLEATNAFSSLLFATPAQRSAVLAGQTSDTDGGAAEEGGDDDEWGDEWSEEDLAPTEEAEAEQLPEWIRRRGQAAIASTLPPRLPSGAPEADVEPLVVAYMPEDQARAKGKGFGFCRMLMSAAHNRLDLEVVGRQDTFRNEGGHALASVYARLINEPRHRIVLYMDGDLAIVADDLNTIVDKYLGFGDGNAWVFPGDCTCKPFIMFDNTTCSRVPRADSPYRFLHAGMWMARAGTVVDVLRDAAAIAHLFSPDAELASQHSIISQLRNIKSSAHVFTNYFLSGLVPEMMIDTQAELFQAFTLPVYPAPQQPSGAYCSVSGSHRSQGDCQVPVHTDFEGVFAFPAGSVPRQRCDPLADIVAGTDGATDGVLRNRRTATNPSVLHVPRSRGEVPYNRIASWLWFHRRPPAPGVALANRPFPRCANLPEYRFLWTHPVSTVGSASAGAAVEVSATGEVASGLAVADAEAVSKFGDIPLCPDMFRH